LKELGSEGSGVRSDLDLASLALGRDGGGPSLGHHPRTELAGVGQQGQIESATGAATGHRHKKKPPLSLGEVTAYAVGAVRASSVMDL
jgi:hypothetical protein